MPSRYRPAYRWKGSKRRSEKQRAQLASLHAMTRGGEDNIPPTNTPFSTPSDSPSAQPPRAQAQSLKDKVNTLTKRCSNAANGAERKRRLAQVARDCHTAEKNKADAERKHEKSAAAAHKLKEVTPNLDVYKLSAMRVSNIDLQIRWHRVFDPKVPRAKDLPTRKEEKLLVLREAVERYNQGEARQSESVGVEQAEGSPVGMGSLTRAEGVHDGDWEMDGPDCEFDAADGDDGTSE